MSKKLLVKLTDGTMRTDVAVYSRSFAERLAIVNVLIDNAPPEQCFVEIELRDGRVFYATLVCAATAAGGGSSELLIVRESDRLMPSAYSLATVRSISQLTVAEWAKWVIA